MDQLISDNDLSYDSDIEVGQSVTFDEANGILKVNEKRDLENLSYSNGQTFAGYVLAAQNDDLIITDEGLLIEINL